MSDEKEAVFNSSLITHYSSLPYSFREVGDRSLEPIAQRDGRRPAEQGLWARDVGAALFGVVRREWAGARFAFDADGARDLLGQLAHRELAGVADVNGLVHVEPALRSLLDVHQAHHALDEIVHVAERARLLARAVDGQLLAAQGLHDDVRHDAPVAFEHAWAVGVKDAYDARVHLVLPVVVHHQRLCNPLRFVIA